MELLKLKKVGKVFLAVIIVVIILLIGAVSTVIAYKLRPSLFTRFIGSSAQAAAAQKETQDLISEVGKYIDLPADEAPTVATVSDVEKLKSQPFFAKAQNGDKVLFYTKNKKAYLYRPTTKKIIDVAPLTVGQVPTQNATGSANPTATPAPIKVSLLNGSTTVGLTATAEKKLKSVSGVIVSDKNNANSTTYTKTVVVNLTGVKADLVTKIAQAVGGTVDSLPAGETKNDADVLVILAP